MQISGVQESWELDDGTGNTYSVSSEVSMKAGMNRNLPNQVRILTESEIQERLYGEYLNRSRKIHLKSTHSKNPYSSAEPTTVPLSKESDCSKQQAEEGDPEWTGTVILVGELQRLRAELITLKQERERLERELSYFLAEPTTLGSQVEAPSVAKTNTNTHQVSRSNQISVNLPSQLCNKNVEGHAPLTSDCRGDVQQGKGTSEAVKKVATLTTQLFIKLVWIAIVLAVVGYPLGVHFLQASPSLGTEPSPYTVQVAVYDVRPIADQALGLLQELGYPAFLVELPNRNGKPRYRIYVGRFVTKEEAQIERAQLASDQRFSDAFVRIK